MARTASTMLPLGTTAPYFSLPDTDGLTISRDDFQGAPGLLVMFICNHCPYVVKIKQALAAFADEYADQLPIVAINSNDTGAHPDDSPEKMAADKAQFGYGFPYLFDETQAVAQAYRAACTPDFFLFNGALQLVYRGQFDDSRPGDDLKPDGADLRAAVDALLRGAQIEEDDQKPSLGCNIKWKPGNEPEYFG